MDWGKCLLILAFLVLFTGCYGQLPEEHRKPIFEKFTGHIYKSMGPADHIIFVSQDTRWIKWDNHVMIVRWNYEKQHYAMIYMFKEHVEVDYRKMFLDIYREAYGDFNPIEKEPEDLL